MLTAKVFENGRSQAIRLPKEYRVSEKEMNINKIGDILIVLPKNNKWDNFIAALDLFTDDFLENGRAQLIDQKREQL